MTRILLAATFALLPLQAAAQTIIIPVPPADFPAPAPAPQPDATRDAIPEG